MPTVTPRLGLAQPIGSDQPSEFRIADTANMGTLDNAALYLQGTLAARGALTGLVAGTFYQATDTGTFAEWNGSAWIVYSPQMQVVVAAVSATAAVNTSVVAGAGVTITLPAPTANAVIQVTANSVVSGSSPVIVSYGSAVIFGTGLSSDGASSFLLGSPVASVTLLGSGSTWVIVTGGQDTGWLTITPGGGVSAASGRQAPSGRLLGDQVQFKGSLQTTSLTGTNATVATIPAALYPSATVDINTLAVAPSGDMSSGTLSSAGALVCAIGLNNGTLIPLGNISYPLS